MKIFPILMAGGIGSRLWPLSRAAYPKQFLKLASENSMLQDTAARVSGAGFEPPTIICHQDHRFLVAEHFRQAGQTPRAIILEAEGRGTAFAIAIGALSAQARDAKALILVLSCDHAIKDVKKLQDAVKKASDAAAKGRLAVFGVNPASAHTGYGYIEAGKEDSSGVSAVEKFTEKPDQKTADSYLKSGIHFWNSGIFLFSAAQILKEIEQFAPDVYKAALESWKTAQPDLDFIRLPEAPLKGCPKISIDYAVLEKSKNVSAVKLETGWSDLGSWQSVWDEAPKDAQGNAVRGDAVLLDTKNSLIQAHEKLTVAAIGLDNLAIIADEDAVLVADLSRAQDVAKIVAELDKRGNARHTEHLQVWRPWGNYKILDAGQGYLIKRLTINPGAALSLQYHNHRSEHWVVVKGQIEVTKDETKISLKVNESIYIPIGAHHRIENKGKVPAELIEVQTGEILKEEDIVRLEDRYKRI